MTIERPMVPPWGSSRRGFLFVVAGSTVAAVAPAVSARAADSLGASQACTLWLTCSSTPSCA
jgi:hypothetical protein